MLAKWNDLVILTLIGLAVVAGLIIGLGLAAAMGA